MNTIYKELLEEILPEGILEYFELKGFSKEGIKVSLELEEKNIVPKEAIGISIESKGFYPVKEIQDYPLAGKQMYLKIKRRRWRDKDTKKEIKRDWNIMAGGSKLTQRFADFLKEVDRK